MVWRRLGVRKESGRLASPYRLKNNASYTIIYILDVAHGIIYLLMKYRSVVLYAIIIFCNIQMR